MKNITCWHDIPVSSKCSSIVSLSFIDKKCQRKKVWKSVMTKKLTIKLYVRVKWNIYIYSITWSNDFMIVKSCLMGTLM